MASGNCRPLKVGWILNGVDRSRQPDRRPGLIPFRQTNADARTNFTACLETPVKRSCRIILHSSLTPVPRDASQLQCSRLKRQRTTRRAWSSLVRDTICEIGWSPSYQGEISHARRNRGREGRDRGAEPPGRPRRAPWTRCQERWSSACESLI